MLKGKIRKTALWLLFLLLSGGFLSSDEPIAKKILFITDKLRVSGVDQAFISLMNRWAITGVTIESLLKSF